jgi:PleD family two-component response regulator
LRREIENIEISYEDNELKITVSIGMTTLAYTELSTPIDEVLNRVDGYLYLAKDSGRNCVVQK